MYVCPCPNTIPSFYVKKNVEQHIYYKSAYYKSASY